MAEDPIEWASPIVIEVKRNGKVRICADFKVTINPYVIKQLHPLKTIAEILEKFAGFVIFSIIDLKDAYYQILIHPSCRKYLVIVTHRGYFRYKRMPFGITIAPMVFQARMDALFADLLGVVVVQDDIGVGGKNHADHMHLLRIVFRRLQDIGLAIQPNKVSLLKTEIVFLGYIIDARGVRPVPTKVDAIKLMPAPTNTTELRSFLGSVNQFNSFVPNLLPSCQVLHKLLQKNVRWFWTKREQQVFDQVKASITSDQILAHFDPHIPVILCCDASEYGIGAVLLHRYHDGKIRMISAASRTLTPAEKNYAAIDREALAIVFAADRFYNYLFGRHFFLCTDHQPLERILGEKAEIPKLAASRLVRWAIQLSAFDYTLTHIPGKENCIADSLSRLPVPGNPTDFELEASVSVNQIVNESIDHLALTRTLIQHRTKADPNLQLVIRYLCSNWPLSKDIPSEVRLFYEKRDLLSYEDGMVMLGVRVVIPHSIRPFVLEKLHFTHPGINAVKSLARNSVWWPRCDSDIEFFVKRCDHCQSNGPNEPQTPLNLWNTLEKVWDRIHIDFCGPYDGMQWFVVIDAFSRWLEILPMAHANSTNAINSLRQLFSRYGLPRQIVSDNGAQFTSAEFKSFCHTNGVKMIFTTLYHSRSNGMAERAIRTFKTRFAKTRADIPDRFERLQELLFIYRVTQHNTTGRTPAELFLGRHINTIFDLLKPSLQSQISRNQFRMKFNRDKHSQEREFSPNEPVYVRRPIDKVWAPSVISARTSPLSYRLENGDRVHADHLKPRFESQSDVAVASTSTQSLAPEPNVPDSPRVSESSFQDSTLRRSTRSTKGQPPKAFHDQFLY